MLMIHAHFNVIFYSLSSIIYEYYHHFESSAIVKTKAESFKEELLKEEL